ncbi:MAG: hypothetical protein M5U34_47980 [Chloroflexi bacterium]|nr:hypothetical protein [Chloroflexota bacterium]
MARFFGFAEVMGRLYGTLLLSPEELSLDDLASQLEISKGSVSMNMRALERWGMAKEVWVRGERKNITPLNMICGRSFAMFSAAGSGVKYSWRCMYWATA